MKKNSAIERVANIAIWIGVVGIIALVWWGVIELLWFCDSLGMKM